MIEGFSSELNSANARWNGTTTEIPLFVAEECAVELRIPSDSIVIYDTLNVTSTRIIEGLVITDFESGIDNDWNIFAQSGGNMSFFIDSTITPAQGNAYYDMGGEVTFDFLIGLLSFPVVLSAMTLMIYPMTQLRSISMSCSMFQKGIVNEIVLFQFREDDNGDGVFTENAEDMFALELAAADLDAGWQLVSIRYADMPTCRMVNQRHHLAMDCMNLISFKESLVYSLQILRVDILRHLWII